MSTAYPSLDTAYSGILRDISSCGIVVDSVVDPCSVGSKFGVAERPFREIINYSFSIGDPTRRTVRSRIRNVNVPFAIANTLWMLSGSDLLSFIGSYNELGGKFSDNNETLHGAHGKRLFDHGGVNQVLALRERLRDDTQSRRAVAVLLSATDAPSKSRDIPCVISLQFMIREGRLHCIVNMRSQSAAMVLPYDVFSFTFLQECLALDLGVGIGAYHHNAGSMHYYCDEADLVSRMLDDECVGTPDTEAPQMPLSVNPFFAVSELLKFESEIRTAISLGDSITSFPMPDLPAYWQDLGYILVSGLRNGAPAFRQQALSNLSSCWGPICGNQKSVASLT